uniref:UBC core domain-containing protein n=1 Tax=Clytia hemisphaerica TaxID=252671 RepID=A0A7M5X9Y1_9CNID
MSDKEELVIKTSSSDNNSSFHGNCLDKECPIKNNIQRCKKINLTPDQEKKQWLLRLSGRENTKDKNSAVNGNTSTKPSRIDTDETHLIDSNLEIIDNPSFLKESPGDTQRTTTTGELSNRLVGERKSKPSKGSLEFTDTSNTIQSPSKKNLSQRLKAMRESLNLSFENGGSSTNQRNRSILNSSTFSSTNTSFSTSFDSSLYIDQSTNSASSPDSIFEQFYKTFRDDVIRKELKLLSQHHQDGVYVMPSMNSLQVWFGVIFIRHGPYENGIFHFTVFFKDDFPESIPIIRFRSRVFHPQIEIRKGTFNVRLETDAHKNRIHVWELLKHLRSSFYQLDVNDCMNKHAADMFRTNRTGFVTECRNCVQRSIDSYHRQGAEEEFSNIIENPLKSRLVEDDFFKGFIKFLVANARNNQYGSSLTNAIGWAKNQLGRVLNNLNTSYSMMGNDE